MAAVAGLVGGLVAFALLLRSPNRSPEFRAVFPLAGIVLGVAIFALIYILVGRE